MGKPELRGGSRALSPLPGRTRAHLLEGLPELATRGHAQLLSDVGGHLQQQHLHESGHDPVLQGGGPRVSGRWVQSTGSSLSTDLA